MSLTNLSRTAFTHLLFASLACAHQGLHVRHHTSSADVVSDQSSPQGNHPITAWTHAKQIIDSGPSTQTTTGRSQTLTTRSDAIVDNRSLQISLAASSQTDCSSDRYITPISPTTGSFEELKAGPLRNADTADGTWTAAVGQAEITAKFAHTGKQCLHIFGGEERVVAIQLKKTTHQQMSFWAERWTSRAPFTFRIEALIANEWQEVFNGDDTIRVGNRFLSHVKFDLPESVTALRFKCTSPPNSGVLLDDFAFTRHADMRAIGASHTRWVAPALRGKVSPITQVSIPATGSRKPLTVTQLKVRFSSDTSLSDIETVHALGQSLPTDRTMIFEGRRGLKDGENRLSISVEPSTEADLAARITATVTEVLLSNGTTLIPEGIATAQRIGVALRTAGQDNCHTYRIPGLVTTNKGTLIAVYDNRHQSGGDLPGDIDVGMSRSTDGGSSWEAMRTIMDMGNDPKWSFDGIGDPAVLVDKVTNRIWVAATWSHGNRSWHGSGPGMQPTETGQLMLAHSDDDGKTWSKPRNITKQIKTPKWRFVLQGPGRGITMHDGTLVFAAQFRSADNGPHQGKPFSTMLSSRDRGETWQIGTGAKVATTESQLVELDDGVIMINCRDDRGGSRSVYTTNDLGKSWILHPTSRQALIEPTCMASLLRIDHKTLGRLLMFSNPNSRAGRFDMTLKVSTDDGQTWPTRWHTLYDQRVGAGYSCLTRVDKDHIGVVYEGIRELYYLRFTIRELLGT